jgi:hypothetical protein
MRGCITQCFQVFTIIVTIIGIGRAFRKVVMARSIRFLVAQQSFPVAAVTRFVRWLVVDRGVGICPGRGGSLSEVAFFGDLALLAMVAGPATIALWSVSKYMGEKLMMLQ